MCSPSFPSCRPGGYQREHWCWPAPSSARDFSLRLTVLLRIFECMSASTSNFWSGALCSCKLAIAGTQRSENIICIKTKRFDLILPMAMLRLCFPESGISWHSAADWADSAPLGHHRAPETKLLLIWHKLLRCLWCINSWIIWRERQYVVKSFF